MTKAVPALEAKLPQLKTPLPGPEARRIVKLDERYISPSYTRPYPLVARRGRGAVVEDVDGNLFLDFSAGIAVVATGHCHPEVVQAVQQQAAELLHMSGTDFYYENMITLAQKLEAITPGDFPKRVFYGNSGAEAIECALKLARYATGRKNFIAFQGCFHGRTYGALSLTASKSVQRERFGPFLSGVLHAPYAYPYRCPVGAPPEKCAQACLNFLENVLLKTVSAPEEVAAIIVEPIQGEGGYVVPPDEFLQGLERLCRRHGMLLVMDEVQTGMGRTGRWWACQHPGVTPDILCIAKGIASGLPLGACVARADLMSWPPGAHASTFGGNPVSVAAALTTIRLIEDGLMENARRLGDTILGKLADWPRRHRLVGEVRGRGLMIGLELVRDKKTKEPAREEAKALVEGAFHRGLLLLTCGASTVRLVPPLVIDAEQADCALALLEEALAEIENR
ncbi:acetyl ornithine aminotransferase family protein [Acidobacteriia bacterium AH_259_A11_L15]|nr:acetyl ornithine aminotransferase family protein [Acidobacteriia bacterium AH_259_A11_L15]